MKNSFLKILVPPLAIAIFGTISFAINSEITIDKNTLSLVNKDEMLQSSFDSKYNISSTRDEVDGNFSNQIKNLTKKTTFLLLGDENIKNESSEDYYKRHKDYLDLRYNPEIPKDESDIIGLDRNSQEYKDDVLSGFSVPGMFNKLNELDIQYSSFDKIRVAKVNDEVVISSIILPKVKMKEQDTQNPMNYNYIQTDLTLYYYFKKLNEEYKLYYLYGETNDDIESYIESNKETNGELSKSANYDSELRDLYDFSKADAISDENINSIFEANKNSIVFINANNNMNTIVSSNGFFIGNGIIVTTYNFLEKALTKAQLITINDSSGNVYELEGVVTTNIENDIAILKVKESATKKIEYSDVNEMKKGDAVISISSSTGVGLASNKGIVASTDNGMQVTIPVVDANQGSPVFTADGKIFGMINSELLNSSISHITGLSILKEYYKMFENNTDIKFVSFDDLKEKYYIKYSDEKNISNVTQDKMKEYKNVESATDFIKLDLVKSSYEDGAISLRFKNDAAYYIDTMQFAVDYRENLKKQGYEENIISNDKYIYKNDKYQIVVMKEFNYSIIVMLKL